MRTQDEEPPYTVLARMPGTVSIKGVAPMVSETLSGHGKPDGCLTVLWTRQTRGAYPAGQTGYSPPIPKAGIGGSPRFAAHAACRLSEFVERAPENGRIRRRSP